MITFPNAKINIGLNILKKRIDGYHDLQTVMVPVGWTDILEITPLPDKSNDQLTITGRTIDCPPEKNLVMKAVAAMRKNYTIPHVYVHLHKIIPDGAGLGGGSADAAFTIRMLKDMFVPEASDTQLVEIASTLGADCPFFIYNRPMLCEGTGTNMNPFELKLPDAIKIVIIKPHVSVSTREAYSNVQPFIPDHSLPELLGQLHLNNWQNKIINDFEKSVFPSFPSIAEIKDKLIDMGALYSSMSGSGSAVYGLFRADNISGSLAEIFPECDICVTKIV